MAVRKINTKKVAKKKKKRLGRKPRVYDQKRLIIAAIRKIWFWSPQRRLALKQALGYNGRYMCSNCSPKVHKFEISDVNVDHINPVIDPSSGWIGFDSYIERTNGPLQVLCKPCHKEKTQAENKKRTKK